MSFQMLLLDADKILTTQVCFESTLRDMRKSKTVLCRLLKLESKLCVRLAVYSHL